MRTIYIQAVVWKEGKHFVSQCLNFDIASHGSTEALALTNLKEAIELSLEKKKTRRLAEVKKPNLVSLRLTYA